MFSFDVCVSVHSDPLVRLVETSNVIEMPNATDSKLSKDPSRESSNKIP